MRRSAPFTLNGKPVRLETDDKRSLLWALRTDLGLTGTKYGCGAGLCGSCTVVVDGKAVRSCRASLADVQGKKVTTIEGLASGGRLAPAPAGVRRRRRPPVRLLHAGDDHERLRAAPRGPSPSREKVKDAMEGNLCRCSAYKRILEAIESVARQGRRPAMSADLRPSRVPEARRRRHRRPRPPPAAGRPRPGSQLSHRPQRLPPHRRGRPRHRLLREDRDGAGRRRPRSPRWRPRSSAWASTRSRWSWATPTAARSTWGRSGRSRRACSARRCARRPAEARLVLVRLASEQLGVPKERLVVENGHRLREGEPARKVSYGALAKGQAITRTVDEKAVLRAVAEFTVMGRSPRRLDAVDKVTGAGKYAGDIRLPGPALRAHPAPARPRRDPRPRWTCPRPRKLDGVTVVTRTGSSRCCTLTRRSRRRPSRACDRSGTPPRRGRTRTGSSTISWDGRERRRRRTSGGTWRRPARPRARRFESTFHKGYVAHAPIEPHASTATFEGGKLTVWASTQTPFPTRDGLAQALALDPKNVRVVDPLRRRRLRREELRPPVRGGGAPREDHRPAGAGGLHPRRGVLLRRVRPGLRS